MAVEDLTYGVAFLYGILAFVSPCILPLIPSYVSFLSGVSSAAVKERGFQAHERSTTFWHGLMFVIGFSIVFIVLGALAQGLRRVLADHFAVKSVPELRHFVSVVGGIVIILMGIYMTGIVKVGFLERERRFQVSRKPVGYLGSVLVGMIFGFGWSPCLGPVLAAILMLAVTRGQASAVAMMSVFALGLAIPFILVSVGLHTFFKYFTALNKYTGAIAVVSGLILIAVGVTMTIGWFNRLPGLVGM